MSAQREAGAAMLAFLAVILGAYTALVLRFGYDDILRQAPAVVLARFHAGGPALVIAWMAFAAGALAFAWVGRAAERAVGLIPGWLPPAAAIAQATGLSRWVTAVPLLAAAHQSPAASDATRQAAELAYLGLHQFAGAGLGEAIGQTLLAAWTLRLGRGLLEDGSTWLGVAGLAIVPLWVAGLAEPLAAGLPALAGFEVAPVAFLAWEAWIATLAVVWLAQGRDWRGRR